MTRNQLVAAVIALLEAGNVDAYELDDLKKLGRLPDNYAEVHLSHRRTGTTRSGVRSDVRGWRLQLRVCAKSMHNANTYLDRTHAALYGKRLAGATTPLDAGPSDVPGLDEGYYAALTEFTFTT